MTSYGWRFTALKASGARVPVPFTATGTLGQDLSGKSRKTLNGLALLPADAALLDLSADTVLAELVIDGTAYEMGKYRAAVDTVAVDVILLDGAPADVVHVDFADLFLQLERSDEVPRTAPAGTDPTWLMRELIAECALPASIAGPVAAIADDVTWAPFTTHEAVVSQLAEIAGHRRPWMDRHGIIRSVAALTVDAVPIALEDLGPEAGTVSVENAYLTAPNRVVVYDDQAAVPLVGVWNAPASAPNSVARRGFVLTQGVQQQGLAGVAHATAIAEAIGEQASARRLNATIEPTWRLDGPTVLSFRDALWLCQSWSVGTGKGSKMTMSATELP